MTRSKNNKMKNILIKTGIAAISLMLAGQAAFAQDATANIDMSKVVFKPIDPENVIVIDTTKGQIIVALSPEIAPNHVERIKTLVRQGFYDGVVFHRVIDGFMDQTGDPTGTGTGGSQLPDLKAEFTFSRGKDSPFVEAATINGRSLGYLGFLPATSQPSALLSIIKSGQLTAFANHCEGTASMARAMDPDSGNSQFFLMRGETPALNAKYSVWGRVVSGVDVVKAIKIGEPVVDPDKMIKVQVLADIKDKNRPKAFYEDPNSNYFKQRLAAEVTAKGDSFNNCSFEPLVKAQ